MKLDLSNLKKAIAQFEKSLKYSHSDLARKDVELKLLFRLAAILAFGFTYDLCWKMLKRYLQMTDSNPSNVDKLSFSQLICLGHEKGLLLSDNKNWNIYRENRSLTGSSYNEDSIDKIYLLLDDFLEEAKFLVNALQHKH